MNTIAAVLYCAANELLTEMQEDINGRLYFSCNAVREAAFQLSKFSVPTKTILKFVEGLGVEDTLHQFDEFPIGPERQQARYNWLMFAAMIALEEFPDEPEYEDGPVCTDWEEAFKETFGIQWLMEYLHDLQGLGHTSQQYVEDLGYFDFR